MNIILLSYSKTETFRAASLGHILASSIKGSIITLAAPESSISLARHISSFNSFITLGESTASVPSPYHIIRDWSRIRSRRFDKAFLCTDSFYLHMLAYFGGIPDRVGLGATLPSRLSLTAITHTAPQFNLNHSIPSLASHIVPKVTHTPLSYEISPTALKNAVSFLGISSPPYIAIMPGSDSPLQRPNKRKYGTGWPISSYAQLALLIQREYNATPIVLGTTNDSKLVQSLASYITTSPVALSYIDTEENLAAILRCCQLCISSHNYYIHLATAVGIPTIGLFGSLNGARHNPVGHNKIIIQAIPRDRTPHPSQISPESLRVISPADVLRAIHYVLSPTASPRIP